MTARSGTRRPRRVAALIAVVGLVLTGLSTYATARVDYNAEQRLLETQTKQVGAVLSTAILAIQSPLNTALSVQMVAGPEDAAAFRGSIAPSVGANRVFVSASLWERQQGRLTRVAQVGAPAALPPAAAKPYLRRTFAHQGYTVRAINRDGRRRIAYALADERGRYLVYAEREIPASRRTPVDRDSAFAELHYAIYLGPRATLAALQTTDVEPSSLPLDGHTARTSIPFGDSTLTVVTSPRRHLGAALSQHLPLILLGAGLLLTLTAAAAGWLLVRRRGEVEALYGEQREVSVRLQRALLPPVIPDIENLDIAVEYVAGARGVDIGGDWYSLVGLDGDRFAFVVGDVSGHGIDAVAVMARARFTLRAYLLRGDSPQAALEMCSSQFDITADGHLVTVVVGVGNHRTGEVVLASAGHPAPLLIDGGSAGFVDVVTGPPLGTGPAAYVPTVVELPAGSTLMCFTDGLVERRTEDIDTGLERLATTAVAAAGRSVTDLVEHTVTTLRSPDAADDIAVLALRWRAGA